MPAAGRMRSIMIVAIGAAAIVAATVLLFLLRNDDLPAVQTLVPRAAEPAAMAALPDGSLIYAERATGRVRLVDRNGRLHADPIARVTVTSSGGRGLLGLAVGIEERIYVAWTRPDGRLLVGWVDTEGSHVVWKGPATGAGFTGGDIALTLEGDVVVSPGDRGELLTVDPDGPPDQKPVVRAGGWTDPLAFTINPAGELWLVDSVGVDESARVALVAHDGPSPVTDLEDDPPPSGVAMTEDDRLAICFAASRELRLFNTEDNGEVSVEGQLVAEDCSLGVVTMADGRLAYATEDSIETVRP